MKKLFSFLVTLSMLMTVAPTVAFAHSTTSDKTIVDLIAGRHIDVGSVKVWNDNENLYVKYMTDTNWCLDETHLQVALMIFLRQMVIPSPVSSSIKIRKSVCLDSFILSR